ncbi:MAG: ABC transporter ATP-binding protein [Mycoplasmoidaceae bacterium]|nr:ABC transporter ATP-binding protein [Mycoplasmoidaceae bacterium]
MANNFLKLQDINKTYSNGYVAIKNFNLSIKKGEFVTLLGPSGCGKTTTLKMVAGFESPTSGRILINNVDIKDLAINKRPTATVFQDYALFPNLSVIENVSYGLKMMRKPLKGITNEERKKVDRAYKDAVKKASIEIKKIEKKQKKLLKEISSLEKIYTKYPEVLAIKNMRYQQFISKIDSYLTQMNKKYGMEKPKRLSFGNFVKKTVNT